MLCYPLDCFTLGVVAFNMILPVAVSCAVHELRRSPIAQTPSGSACNVPVCRVKLPSLADYTFGEKKRCSLKIPYFEFLSTHYVKNLQIGGMTVV